MADVTETRLPGVGVRHDFTTAHGERVGVLLHRSGRRELMVYRRDDPDTATTVMHLDADDTRTLAELLGGAQVSETITAVQQQLEGVAIEWITLPATSSLVGATIADGQLRTRTGTSVVAVVRGATTVPAPEPTHEFAAGDIVVAVGTPNGLAQLRNLLLDT
jgi:TrkA domain protein